MRTITTETLPEFRPTYDEYERRRLATAKHIGVESEEDLKDYRSQIEQWNTHSAIGFDKAETNIIALILSEEEANIRFNNNVFMHRDYGGNTAEHPLFMGHKIDALRDNAGFGPARFLKDYRTLPAARLCQSLHALTAMHDIGELIDISFSEQKIVNASFKEPPEEALVGPFKLQLAAYAISQRDPMLYIHTMYEARKRIREVKQSLFEQAKAGTITGDAFVTGVGHEIRSIIDDTTAKLEQGRGPLTAQLRPEYSTALSTLVGIFNHSQSLTGFEGAMFNLIDKYEGDSHFRHFIGRPKSEHSHTTPIMERMFNNGTHLSYHMASSAQVVNSVQYAQKAIPAVFAEAEALPPGDEKEVALSFARAGTAALLRNHIRILQKAPPMIDVSKQDNKDAALTADETLQTSEFRRRLDTQRSFIRAWDAQQHIKEWKTIEGIVPRDLIIAALDKAASAIEEGRYTPTAKDIPIGFGPLPEALYVTRSELERASQKHPSPTFILGG